jgi:hypothetical protein
VGAVAAATPFSVSDPAESLNCLDGVSVFRHISNMNQVREHLRLLSIFHYVVWGVGYLFSLIPCIHLAIGIFFLVAPEETFEVPTPPRPVRISPEPGVETPSAAPVPSVAPFPAKRFGLIFTSVASVIIIAGMIVST